MMNTRATSLSRFLHARALARLCACALTALVLAAAAHAQPSLTMKRIVTTSWPIIEVYFSIDCDGKPVFNAAQENFRVFEDGVEAPTLTFACADPSRRCPMTAGLVLDASGSMAGAGRDGAVAASTAFINLMDGVDDEAAIVFAGDSVRVMQLITTDKSLLRQAVNNLTAIGTTVLWDGAFEALQLLIQNGPTQCRAIILLSDGNDVSSDHLPQTLINTANANNIRIFTIGLGKNINRSTLTSLASLTGGVYYESPTPSELVPIFTEISRIISEGFRECKITYRATCSEERVRRVDLLISNFCSGSDVKSLTYSITQTPTVPHPTVTAKGPTRFCQGGSVDLEADSGYASYHWSNGATTRGTTSTRTGRYTVIVADTAGCTGTAYMDVLVDSIPLPVITASGPTSFCAGDSVTLDAGGGFTSYRWSTGETARAITVKSGGMYSVHVTNAAGCANTSDNVAIRSWTLTPPVITGSRSTCRLSTVTYSVPRDTLVWYSWTIDGGVVLNGGNSPRPLVRWDREGTGLLRLVMRHDSADCTLEIVDTVLVYSSIDVRLAALGPTTVCEGDSVVLDAGAGFASYLWRNGATARMVAARATGRYAVEVRDANGCSGTDSIDVVVNMRPRPTVTATPGFSVCAGDSVVLDAAPGYASYRWSNGATGPRIALTHSDTVFVIVTSVEGCDGASAPVPVTVHPLPAKPLVVQNDSLLMAPSGFAYQWRINGSPIPGATQQGYKAANDGTYAVMVTDSNGCSRQSDDLDVVLNQYTVLAIDCPPARPYQPGEAIAMPISLVDANLPARGTRNYRIVLRYDRNAIALEPGQNLPFRDQGPERLVSLSGVRAEGATKAVLGVVRWIATVGDSACAHIAIDSVIWSDGMPRIVLRDAACEICTNICRAGGDRLYQAHGDGAVIQFTNHPNPFNASTTIECRLSADRIARIRVLDVLGREVAVLHDGGLSAGDHAFVFDRATLPSGVYTCILQTTEGVEVLLMETIK